MRRIQGWLAFASFLSLTSVASAYPAYLTAFNNKYPTSTLGTRLGCNICHTPDGTDTANCYKKRLSQLGSAVDIATRINMLDGEDSDGDGVPDCLDQCPGVDDHLDANNDGVPDCQEGGAFTVNTTDDTVDANVGDDVCADADGHCSLRAAIMESNAKPNRNTIIVPAGHYRLTIAGSGQDDHAGDLNVIEDVTISGAGPSQTIIDANGLDRVFDFGSYQSVITLTGLTLTGGVSNAYGGGAIYSLDNTLTIRNCVISGNTLTNSDAHGGGIFVGGTFVMENCTITGNTASGSDAIGGGINCYDAGTNTITNCTITGNTATGIHAVGGGIGVLFSTTNLINCTIADNSATAGAANVFYDSTGIPGFPINFHNTIVANANGTSNCILQNGEFNSLGHNLEDADTCSFHGAGDLINTDPKLGALGDNGGLTPTMALLDGSPAIDAGDPAAGGANDQRGFARPADGNSDGTALTDIGAFEYSDCNQNGTDDGTEIANGVEFPDCNHNGIPDACELAGDDCNHNGVPDECDADADGDGIPNDCDACPNGGDATDSDGDGTPNCADGCPNDPLKTAPGACGCGLPDIDSDGDGVADCVDNCPQVPNIGQEDSNGDGIGDACEAEGGGGGNGEPNNGGTGGESGGTTQNTNCGASLCGAGTAAMMPLMLAMMVGMKRRKR